MGGEVMDKTNETAAWLVGRESGGGILLQISNLTTGASMSLTLPPVEAAMIADQLTMQAELSRAMCESIREERQP